ncbi:hypothetical protein Avbf_05232 [Armadillidium vulgare]|nr:hypothetical protein Avbf_05232 [Armadillidium vulgare]
MPDGPSSAPSSSTLQDQKVEQRSSPRTSPLKSKDFETRFESARHEPLVSPPERLDVNPQSQYQVKWSNHASRLSSFVSSLEGDVASSDTILSLKDGSTIYVHRLVLACASPFFTRTLKNILQKVNTISSRRNKAYLPLQHSRA